MAERVERPDLDLPAGPPRAGLALCVSLAVLGGVSLATGLETDPLRAWRAYLVNFLFFTGIGVGGILFVCALNLCSGRWGRDVKRVAEGLGAFVPVSLLLFLVLVPGLEQVLPWVRTPYGPSWWLDLECLVWRDGLGLLLLALLAVGVVYLSLRVDFGHAREAGRAPAGRFARLCARGWRGSESEDRKARRLLTLLSPIYAISFAVVLTLLAVDLIMSLKRGWVSTLIGAYYFVSCFYVSLAALLVAVIWTRSRFRLHDRIRPSHLHDIAKLSMGFGVVSGDFFYTQLVVIWYGNIPAETSFLIDRVHSLPWRLVGIAVMLLCFALPVAAMLRRGLKERAGPMLLFAGTVLSAMWAERLLLVGPSITGTGAVRFGTTEVLVTLGFLGLAGFTFLTFMSLVPPVTIHDAVLDHAEGDS